MQQVTPLMLVIVVSLGHYLLAEVPLIYMPTMAMVDTQQQSLQQTWPQVHRSIYPLFLNPRRGL